MGARCSVDSSVFVSPLAKLGNDCRVGSGSKLLGRVDLGNHVWIDSNVTLYGTVRVGNRAYVGSNCTLGHFDRKTLTRMMTERNIDLVTPSGRLEIGEDCIVRQGCIVYSSVRIGSKVEFGHNVLIRENTTIGSRTLIGTGVVIDGDSSVGENVSIQTGVYISRCCKIADRVFLGPRCVLLNDKYMMLKKPKLVGPVIGTGSAIGGNATIMPGVRIGKRVVIGAGSVVNCNVPDGTVYVGVPARRIKATPKDWRLLLGSRC
jgi:acetyltransferase-like isoleucine patch superfamily enzyme